MENKLAVIFPGIGYHTDKPLLYYGKKIWIRDTGNKLWRIFEGYKGRPGEDAGDL